MHKCIGINGNFLKLVESFLSNRYQHVVLNSQASSWAEVRAGVPQGSILGPLFFLIYINDLSENLKSTVKLFADDTSLFHVIKHPNTSAEILNHEITRISEWAYRWKMSFNPDTLKQVQGCFLIKLRRQIIQILYLMVTRYKKVPIKSTLV